MRALEQKDVASIVEVLAQLTPAVVNGKCSPLVRLCITQQLAADMSERIPQEVNSPYTVPIFTHPFTHIAD